MSNDSVSARQLRDHLRSVRREDGTGPRHLNEGASRVLRKLETVIHAAGLHRVYLRSGRRVTLWDVVSDEELDDRGYVFGGGTARAIGRGDALKSDSITLWTSQSDALHELWVGERLDP